MLSPVPDMYLSGTNNLNIPVGVTGPLGSISLKKAITSHVEMGYQFDYLRLQGKVSNLEGVKLEVLTQIYSHIFQVQYNFKKNNQFKPPFNYFLYFKMGGNFVKNNPVKEENAPLSTNIQNKATPQALVTVLGAGLNYQLTDNFSLTSCLDINKSSNGVDGITHFYKIFYSSNHLNYYMQASLGLSWWFNLRSKGFTKNDSYSIWYDSSRGKK